MKFNRKVHIGITDNFFSAYAMQFRPMPIQNGLFELIDNALSSPKKDQTACILLDISSAGKKKVRFTVADWGQGMNADELENALQFGNMHSGEEGNLVTHGLGLNNALLTITQHKPDNEWLIASRKPKEKVYHVVNGPFDDDLDMNDTDELPLKQLVMRPLKQDFYSLGFCGEPSTVVSS